MLYKRAELDLRLTKNSLFRICQCFIRRPCYIMVDNRLRSWRDCCCRNQHRSCSLLTCRSWRRLRTDVTNVQRESSNVENYRRQIDRSWSNERGSKIFLNFPKQSLEPGLVPPPNYKCNVPWLSIPCIDKRTAQVIVLTLYSIKLITLPLHQQMYFAWCDLVLCILCSKI